MASAIGFFLDFSLTWLVWFIVICIGIRIYAKIRKIDDYKKFVVRGCWVAMLFGLIVAALNIYNSTDNSSTSAPVSQEIINNQLSNKSLQSADIKKDGRSYESQTTLTVKEWLERGAAYGISEQYDNAINAYSKAIELDPQCAEAYNQRGVNYGRVKNYQKAMEDINKAIEIAPNLSSAYCNRGFVYSEVGNKSKAIIDYNRAIEIDPNDEVTYERRGTFYGQSGNYDQSIKDFNVAIKINPQFALAFFNRGMTHGNLGNHKQAIEDVKKAAQLGHYAARDFLQGQGIRW